MYQYPHCHKAQNKTARLFAHPLLGAVSAYISGNDATSRAAWLSAIIKTVIAYLIPNDKLADKFSKYTTRPLDGIAIAAQINAYMLHLEAEGKLPEAKIIADIITQPTNISEKNAVIEQAVDDFVSWVIEESFKDK